MQDISEMTVEDRAWTRDVLGFADACEDGDSYGATLFEQWSPDEWAMLAESIAARGLHFISEDERSCWKTVPARLAVVPIGHEGYAPVRLIGPDANSCWSTRFAETACVGCGARDDLGVVMAAPAKEPTPIIGLPGVTPVLACDDCADYWCRVCRGMGRTDVGTARRVCPWCRGTGAAHCGDCLQPCGRGTICLACAVRA